MCHRFACDEVVCDKVACENAACERDVCVGERVLPLKGSRWKRCV